MLLGTSAALLLAAPVAEPQGRAQLGIDARRHLGIVTVNPLAVLAGALNGDVELNIGTGVTGALSATYWPDDYRSVDLTFRYYPGELNPKGFSVGVSLGHAHVIDDDDDPLLVDNDEIKGPAIGFIIGYNWILGRSQRLAIATGIGAKRIFADEDKYPNGEELIPSGRFGVGITF